MMPEAFPFSSRILVTGTKGALEYTFRVAANVQERESASHFFRLYKSDGTSSEPSVSNEDAYVAQFRYFIRCLEQHQPPATCPPQESCRVMEVMTALRQSADSRQLVTLGA